MPAKRGKGTRRSGGSDDTTRDTSGRTGSEAVSAPPPQPEAGAKNEAAQPAAPGASGQRATPPSFLVGLGASAGGLEALERFFKAAPPNTGMAFVVIQHLSPDFKSLMDELLARHTKMPIKRVTEPMDLVADTIYLLPPRKEMIMEQGRLLVVNKPTDHSLSMPINTFFRAMAREMGDRSVAVVLSGTGTDGSKGLVDVHGIGGLVIVQNEGSAKFDGMPRSAMGTGVVDLVLTPEEMPAALQRHAASFLETDAMGKPSRQAPGRRPGPPSVIDRLREVYGIDFTSYKPGTITRRLERRAAMSMLPSMDHYCERVLADPAELEALYKDLLIGVTRFFRDPEAFQVLRDEVIPSIIDAVPVGEDVRIWVPGCATGEEAYSLGMLALQEFDRRGRAPGLKVFASDMHRDSLRIAAEGVYPEDSLEALTAEQWEGYFLRESDGRYRVAPRLRKVVLFSPHNVIRDTPFSRIDLVSCRNLLIYFQPAAQMRAIGAFHFALKMRGYLFLGPSESTGEMEREFEPVDKHWKIYRKISDARLPVALRIDVSRAAESHPTHAAHADQRLARAYDSLLSRFVPTGVLVNEKREVLHLFGSVGRFLRTPAGRLNTDLVGMCQGDLRVAVSSAIHHALKKGEKVVFKSVRAAVDQQDTLLDIVAEPMLDRVSSVTFVLVLFCEERPAASSTVVEVEELALRDEARERIVQLETELQQSRESLQTAVEELESTNEELQASNEELLASNEELQSTNEELHSVNEELYTVNAENEEKIRELNATTADLRNLIEATDVGIIFTDREQRVRLFTPGATALFNLLPQDIGRDLRHITSQIPDDDVFADVAVVLKDQVKHEKQVWTGDGRSYLRRIQPYLDANKKSAGLVLTFVEITQLVQTTKALEASEARLRNIYQTSPVSIWQQDWSEVTRALAELRALGVEDLEEHLRAQPVLVQKLLKSVRTLDVNPWTLDIFKARSKAVLLASLDLVFPHTDAQGGFAAALGALAGGKTSFITEVSAQNLEGEKLDLLLSFSLPKQDEAGYLVLLTVVDITVRKRSEEQLRIFSRCVEQSPLSVVLTDTRGIIQFANPRFTALTGFTAEDVLGKTPRLLKSGTMAPEIYRDLWETVLAGRKWSGELCNRKKSGELYWESALICPVFDGQGQATHFLAIKEDITDRKRTQEALRESEERFRLITEGTPAAVIMVDDTGTIVHANPQAKGVFGYQPQELVSRRVEELIPARLRRGHAGLFAGFLRDPRVRAMGEGRELVALHHDGREIAVEISLSPIQTGGRTYVLAFITDISVRKQAEAAVRESEERFRQLANNAPVMIWLADQSGRRTFFNETWLHFTGRALAEELGEGWLEGVHADSRELLLRAYRAACERGEPLELEYRLRRADGSYAWLAMRAKPRFGHEHAFIGLIGCCTDISQQKLMVEEQRRIEEKLQETAKLESLGVLAGGIAHDFNNILTGILGNVSLAQMDHQGNPALRETLAAVYDAAMRASDLCKQMLAYSGRGRFILRRMELGWLVRDTLNLVHAAISKTVRLEIDLAKDLPAVEVDVPQVQQVIMNLVINASEAIGDHPGVIRLTTSRARNNQETYGVEVVAPTRAPSQYVALEVADNGCGISPEGLKRIFDPFYTTKFTGRGLGLAAVQGILRGHRGALYVQSTPGQGTVFTLLLPWVEGLSESGHRAAALPEISPGQGIVLVVDDEEIVRATAARILQRRGYQPVLAVDGLDGIHQFKAAAGTVRLVLLDLTMPGMDGTRTFAELRAIDPSVRVLLMSGFHENEAIGRFSDVAPAAFLQKPIVAEDLLRSIESILRQVP